MENKENNISDGEDDLLKESRKLIDEMKQIFENANITPTSSAGEAEIARIHEFRENFDRNNILEEDQSKTAAISVPEEIPQAEIASVAQQVIPSSDLSINSTGAIRRSRHANVQQNTSDVIILDEDSDPPVIDVDKSLPDDDVIYVTSTPSCLVDLCTPAKKSKKTSENTTTSTSNQNKTNEETLAASGTPIIMCPVCMESCVRRQPTSTKCGHIFCLDCIKEAISITRKCPLCNTKLGKNSTHRIFVL